MLSLILQKMNKYIDAARLRAELEKRLKNIRDYMNGNGVRYKSPRYYEARGKESACDALLSIITSLQQEQMKMPVDGEVHHVLNCHYISTDNTQLCERLREFPEGAKVDIFIFAKEDK